MIFEIKSRFDGSILFSLETESLKLCVEAAVKARAFLARANLAGAFLARANLAGAFLARANLAGANLEGANLVGANLAGANLAGAFLEGANLEGANLVAHLGYPNGWSAFVWVKDNQIRVQVGCRDFTLTKGREYWQNQDDRREVLAALDYAERIAELREWIKPRKTGQARNGSRGHAGIPSAQCFGCSSCCSCSICCWGSEEAMSDVDELVAAHALLKEAREFILLVRLDTTKYGGAGLMDRIDAVIGAPSALRVSIHGMYDCHLFHRVTGTTVDEVIDNWMEHNSKKQPAIVGGDKVDDLGQSVICPAIVLWGDKELRRVGRMVFPDYKTRLPKQEDVDAYRAALLADSDIPSLLAKTKVGKPWL